MFESVCPADNTTLFVQEEPLWEHGYTFHNLGLLIALGFGSIAALIALFLVFEHGIHYSRPYEQKHIIRILIMIPVYAVISFLSYLFYKYTVYWQVIRDCYEAFAIASFFTLMCHYIAPDLHEQKNYFRTATPKNWFWGVFGLQKCTGGKNKGPFRVPRSGLTWFNIVWIGVFQYCLVRVACTIVALVTELLGRYCEHSINPIYGHFWYLVLTAISVTIAMFCLIQFYIQTRVDLAEHKPFLKVLCIKLVIFFSFWQQLVISFLASQYGPLKPSAKLNAPDIYIGIPAVLICVEMAFFAIMHIFAFSWRPYSGQISNKATLSMLDSHDVRPKYFGGFLGIKAYLDAMNPWDFVKASARGFRWLFVGYRHRTKDTSYAQTGEAASTMASYERPLHAVEPATELHAPTSNGPRQNHAYGAATDDDRMGLLHGPGALTHSTTQNSYYNPDPELNWPLTNDTHAELSNNNSLFAHGRPSEYGSESTTAYHSHQHGNDARRPYRPAQAYNPQWEIFAGAGRPAGRLSTAQHQDLNQYPDRI